ncbi:MAG: GTPase HflX [Burkholderiales bacterium]
MVERTGGDSSALLVGLNFGASDAEDSLTELCRLAESAKLRVAATVTGKRAKPDPAYFAGSGKVEEIATALDSSGVRLVIFNHELSPAQERNLERALGCRVIDRTALILDIFAQRANSHDGKLQVELAQLDYLASRLVRGWSHLERQKGGIGLRGPGETQLETDRRLIGKRVKVLRGKLDRLKRQGDIQRRARQRANVFSVSLVGYTNAGKSTLFNCLTHAGGYTADQLFATLNTTTRRVYSQQGAQLVLSDTVGFIKQLPHSLVAAFRATLEETVQADLLLHVVDAASPSRDAQIAEVNKVLGEIGAQDITQIQVFNKIDLTAIVPGLERDEHGRIARLKLSAHSGAGLDLLRAALGEAADSAPSTTLNNSPADPLAQSRATGFAGKSPARIER